MILLSRKQSESLSKRHRPLGSLYTWVFSILCLFNIVSGLPNGSPLCEIDSDRLSGCMGGDNNPSYNYSLFCGDCIVKPGELLPLKLSALVPFYKGLLLYVVGADPKERVGEFTIDTSYFKDNSLKCKKFLLEKPSSVITHKSNAEKATDTTYFWRAPTTCAGKSFSLRSAFIYDQLSHWQVLDPIKVSCTNDPPPAEQSISNTNSQLPLQVAIAKNQTSLIEGLFSKLQFEILSLEQLYKYLFNGIQKKKSQNMPLKANTLSSAILPQSSSHHTSSIDRRHTINYYDQEPPG